MNVLKVIFVILTALMIFGCVKHKPVITELDMENSCFDAVDKKDWSKAKEACTELVIVNDNHYGGWGQLCLAEYHLDHVAEAYQYCSYAIVLGLRDPRILHAFVEIDLVLRDQINQKTLENKKK